MEETHRTGPGDAPSGREGGALEWRRAADFGQLCRLAAAFLEGELEHFPGWMGDSTDPETDEVLPALVGLTRAGVLPLASQLGHPRQRGHDGRSWSRRAFLNGFATPRAERAGAARAAAAGLVWRSFAAAEVGAAREIVGLRGGEAFLWAGQAAGGLELEIFQGEIPAGTHAELARLRYFSTLDPVWGRARRLFEVLDPRGGPEAASES